MAEEQGHILIVDDNRMNRMKLSISLEQLGHTVRLAEDGMQAIQMLGESVYDVVLLDIIMPEMDGFQVLELMKSDSKLRDIPVIVISAVDEIDSAVRCIEMGAEDYLQKPFNPVLLVARLNASLQKKKLRDLEKAYLEQDMMLRQSEKLATLGKLSAGMAHELNNPAAAAKRNAIQLKGEAGEFLRIHLRLRELDFSPAQMETLKTLLQRVEEKIDHSVSLTALEHSDREEALAKWLESQHVENPWKIAATLVDLDFSEEELDKLAELLSAEQLSAGVAWLACIYTISILLDEIDHSTQRISDLVQALKAYSYMDQAPIQMVDIHAGLESTLTLLKNRFQNGTTIQSSFAPGLPHIQAYGSELNQVWTNLIDNAVDAVDGNGEIQIRTYQDQSWVVVEVADNGPGIPEAIQHQVFDPFFTTKPVGTGTGLGLTICHNIVVQKHKGELDLYSKPGETRFVVRLPIQAIRQGV
jgi:signal transduction histidine kinase